MTASVPAAASPLRAVREAIEAGAASMREIATVTGLDPDVVAGAVDHLVRTGTLTASTLSVGCPDDGCGGCASGHGDQPGCGSSGPSRSRRGPVLVALTLRRR